MNKNSHQPSVGLLNAHTTLAPWSTMLTLLFFALCLYVITFNRFISQMAISHCAPWRYLQRRLSFQAHYVCSWQTRTNNPTTIVLCRHKHENLLYCDCLSYPIKMLHSLFSPFSSLFQIWTRR